MTSRPRLLIVLILLITPRALAAPGPSVDVAAAPPIAAAPTAGLDPDVLARLDAAERASAPPAPAQLAPVLDHVLVLYQSTDAFSLAQRDTALPRTLALLGRIGERARAAGELVIAARAFDARWTLAGGTAP